MQTFHTPTLARNGQGLARERCPESSGRPKASPVRASGKLRQDFGHIFRIARQRGVH